MMFIKLEVLFCVLSSCTLVFVDGENVKNDVEAPLRGGRKHQNARSVNMKLGQRSPLFFKSRMRREDAAVKPENRALSDGFDEMAFWESYLLSGQVNSMPPTHAPTKAYTSPPTAKPIFAPTESPTKGPTDAPVPPPIFVDPPPTFVDPPPTFVDPPPTSIPVAPPIVMPTEAPVVMPTEAPVVMPPTEAPTCKPISEIACTTPGLSTLCELVMQAYLTEPFTNDLLTVFAPTDDAFAALPQDLLEILTTDVSLLTEVLWYHVVPTARVLTTDLFCEGGSLDKLKMANGEDTTIMCASSISVNQPTPVVSINIVGNGNTAPGPMIVSANIVACNGIVHIIDGVLLPDTTTESPTSAPVPPTVAPVVPTPQPVNPTPAPVNPTPAPVNPIPTPVVNPTPAPVNPIPTPVVNPTPAPVTPTIAPVTPTIAPVTPSTAPVTPTPAPVTSTPAPVTPTPAPVNPTPAPVNPPTPSPVVPTPAPIAGPPVVLQTIQPVALQGGNEFANPNSIKQELLHERKNKKELTLNLQQKLSNIMHFIQFSWQQVGFRISLQIVKEFLMFQAGLFLRVGNQILLIPVLGLGLVLTVTAIW